MHCITDTVTIVHASSSVTITNNTSVISVCITRIGIRVLCSVNRIRGCNTCRSILRSVELNRILCIVGSRVISYFILMLIR